MSPHPILASPLPPTPSSHGPRRWGAWQPRAGDVLLSRAPLEISRWMAWNAECPFSHAALMLDHDRFVEATMPRVRIGRLSRLRDPELLALYRPLDAEGRVLDVLTARRVARCARARLGVPFALPRMGPLAVHTLLRHKLGLRRLRIENGCANALSCTELVYRALRDELGFDLSPRRRRPQPRPPLRLGVLWREWRASRTAAARGGSVWTGGLRLGDAGAAPGAHEVITTDLCSSPRLALVALQMAR